MKKIKMLCAVILCCAFFLTACSYQTAIEQPSEPSSSESPVVSSPSEVTDSSSLTSTSSEVSSVSEPISEPKVETLCKAYALYCIEDGAMIDSYNADKRISPASLTKLLTASVTLRYLDPDEMITVGSELKLVNEGSSLCMIKPGMKLTVYDLMTGLLLPSGNDAAYTAAVCTARKASGDPDMPDKQAVEYFCGLMNEMAQELGMTGSHFADPDGWDDPEHYTTVSDLVKVSEYALTVPEIRELVSTPEKHVVFESGESLTWRNGNKLLHPENKYYCENAIGMKNGFTDDAGLCLIAAFVKNGKTYLDIVVGSEKDEDRYTKIFQLYDMA